mmetsp:Transcript_56801/g.122811  ORF Transcript_56801/g.122811 Transcript_56801/m.122811 type:complete len:82 (-) Transcript_56801:1385-1630(-)
MGLSRIRDPPPSSESERESGRAGRGLSGSGSRDLLAHTLHTPSNQHHQEDKHNGCEGGPDIGAAICVPALLCLNCLGNNGC